MTSLLQRMSRALQTNGEVKTVGQESSVKKTNVVDVTAEPRTWHLVDLATATDPSAAATGSGIAAASRDSRHMDVFWVGNDGWVYVASWTDGAPWRAPERVTDAQGASKTAGIAALSRRPDHREVWWVAESDGSIQGAYWYDGDLSWTRFTVPGSKDTSKTAGIAALSRTTDHMEVWWIHENGSVWHSWFSESLPEGHKWHEQPVQVPKATSASTTAGIAVMSRSDTHIEVCWVDTNGTVQHSGWTQAGGWDTQPKPVPNALGASKTTGIAALSRSADHMEVWWVDTNGAVKHSWWTSDHDWTSQPEVVPNAVGASTAGGIAVLSRSDTHMEVWWVDKNANLQGSWWTREKSWATQPYQIPDAYSVSTTAGLAALSRSGDHMEVCWIGSQGSVRGAWTQETSPPPPSGESVLDNSTREVLKGTLVSIKSSAHAVQQRSAQSLTGGLIKFVAINQLALNPGDTDAVRARLESASADGDGGSTLRVSDATLGLLAAFEQPVSPILRPGIAAAAHVPADELTTFATVLVDLRTEKLTAGPRLAREPQEAVGQSVMALNGAVVAARALAAGDVQPVGMLNLERIEMAPAGIQRGELVATIPLAPGEQTAVTHKEWSVTSKEFTTVVTDELEEVSEKGVTDNTDLSQSTSSQTNHSNQFNITATVQGGIPIISGSSTTSFTSQDSTSTSATESAKHAQTLTQKASSRSKQEHKTTISTKTETGTEETSTRIVRNLEKYPIRIDYFSMMRKWRVRLYRYGLRLTYDLVIPEPGAAMRRAYARLEWLRNQLGPFQFSVKNDQSYLLEKVDDNENPSATGRPRYQYLADKYDVAVRDFPADPATPVPSTGTVSTGGSWYFKTLDLDIPGDREVAYVMLDALVDKWEDDDLDLDFAVIGAVSDDWQNQTHPLSFSNYKLKSTLPGNPPFLENYSGKHTVTFFFNGADTASLTLRAFIRVTQAAKDAWRNEVWAALFNAAQGKYLADQQEIAGEIAALEDRLANVDTLTLRREENDEIMKNVLQFVLGREFNYMPDAVLIALKAVPGSDPDHGAVFDTPRLGLNEAQWNSVRKHEETIGFINRAIEWENVVSFLYSYFWDIPGSWTFLRQLRHQDPTRQAFLRAGAARVVLTVRKGWERRWTHFVETGEIKTDAEIPDASYLTIAQEIAAYDDRNYPGIPAANPGKAAARLQDAVYTTSTAKLNTGTTKIPVESTKGFLVGLPVMLDSFDDRTVQETVRITAILNDKELGVDKTAKAHDGTQTPFAVLQPGEKGALIAEWNEYTPSSGTDIAITSNVSDIY